ncbi:Mitochondrial adenine nucleotide transporter ADNT1 [Platanthera zijinensis]|uniref:Mitochondrial adenine nucleotide transporter ADNT1 n=1 Tax=Platanthera zijinensis TaxID=2320716 RepID=A0AAP0AZE7_9ASPA
MNLILSDSVSDAKKPCEFLGIYELPVLPLFRLGVFRFCLPEIDGIRSSRNYRPVNSLLLILLTLWLFVAFIFREGFFLFLCLPEMGPSQGSTLPPAAAADVDIRLQDVLPAYVKELIAGGTAGAFSKTAVAPLERLKILMQTGAEEFKSIGILRSLKKLKQHEGFLGFYKYLIMEPWLCVLETHLFNCFKVLCFLFCYTFRGNGASVLRIVPYAALHFTTYEQYRCWILDNCSSLGTGPVVDLFAGSAAGGTAVLCTYPLDLARTKLAYQVSNTGKSSHGLRHLTAQPPYTGIKDVFWSVYKEGGLRSLYRGVGPTLIGILPYAGLKFYIYEELKSRVPEDYKKSVVLRLCCGALAGLFGQTLTYPLDVVRRQMQVQSCQQFDQIGSPRITGAIQGISTIIREQGWKRLFAGLSLNYLKVRKCICNACIVLLNCSR